MNTTRLLLFSLLAAAAIPVQADILYIKANVTGTVETQTLLSPVEGRLHTAQVKNKRIFDEFTVSQEDYQLVLQLGVDAGFVLLPKHISSGLPTITVFKFGPDTQTIIDTKARIFTVAYDIAPGVATNLFKGLKGQVIGAAHYAGSYDDPNFTKIVFRVTGHGTDTSNSGNGPAILSLKFTALGEFVQGN